MLVFALAWGVSSIGQRRGMALGAAAAALDVLRRLRPWLVLRHAALAVALLSGVALLLGLDVATSRAAWLHLKVGLVVFLLLPLEGMHAWVCHVWIAGGLRSTSEPPFAKDLVRGLGMEEMVRALEVPLLGIGVPLLAWLSLAKPRWP